MSTHGPSLLFSQQLHAEKYRGKDESFKEAMNRIAGSLKDNKEHFHEFRDILLDMRFMPAGRIQSAMGSTKNVTPYNCFVSGTIEDSFTDGHGSIMGRATESAQTMRMGGGIGYNFSTLRPRGDLIRKLNSHSSGPVSFMEIFDAICRCVSSSGHRRGAQMGVMRIDHPDVEEFIHAKQPPKAAEPIMNELAKCEPGTPEWSQWYTALQAVYNLTGFNVSLGITDEFMKALLEGRDFSLQFGGREYRRVDARSLWETVMRSTWDWAEPGALFIDTINKMNNLWYCETIAATNPCGEQPLPPHGACLLGSFNLTKYVTGSPGSRNIDFEQFERDIAPVVRAMDNVVDRATYPLYEQEKEAKSKRRMGLGVTGVANALEALGYPYGTQAFLEMEREVMHCLVEHAYRASARLAAEKGSFPLFDAELYMKGKFIENLSEETKSLIRQHGIRNSHLISIAPTGTISMCADNVSSGIEPVFSYKQKRLVHMPEGQVEVDVDDYGYRVFGVEGKRCTDVSVKQHLDVAIVAAKYVDSAVSKTCNVPADTPWEDFKQLYIKAWESGCKGFTTYQVGGKRAGILKSADDENDDRSACEINPETGVRNCE